MSEKKTDGAKSEKEGEDKDLDDLLDDDKDKEDEDKEGKDKEEKSPYELELERLKADQAKKDEIIANKNRAIEAQKKELKELKEKKDVIDDEDHKDDEIVTIEGKPYYKSQVDLIEGLATKKAKELVSAGEEKALLASLVPNEDERKLVTFHLEHSLKRTDDLEQDILNAKVLANTGLVLNHDEEIDNARDEAIAGFATGLGARNSGGSNPDKAKELAKQMLIATGHKSAADRIK